MTRREAQGRVAVAARAGRWRRLLAVLGAAAGLTLGLGAAPDAAASFDAPGFHIEEISAFTLRGEELKIGPAALRYGIAGELQIGTNFALNLIGAVNGDAKWRIFELDHFAIGVEVGFLHFDPAYVGVDTDFGVTTVPARLNLSFPINAGWLVHSRLTYQHASFDADAPDAARRIQRHLGPVGRLAAELFVEWRPSPHFAVVLDYAAPLLMLEDELLYPGEDSAGSMMRVAASLYGTFAEFSFRVGVGYGPSFLGEQSVFPVLDLYWRIY